MSDCMAVNNTYLQDNVQVNAIIPAEMSTCSSEGKDLKMTKI